MRPCAELVVYDLEPRVREAIASRVTSHGWSCLWNRGVIIDYTPAVIDRLVRRALFHVEVID